MGKEPRFLDVYLLIIMKINIGVTSFFFLNMIYWFRCVDLLIYKMNSDKPLLSSISNYSVHTYNVILFNHNSYF